MRVLAFVLLLAACGDDPAVSDADTTATTDADFTTDATTTTTDVTNDAPSLDVELPPEVIEPGDFPSTIARYDLLETIAGRGLQNGDGNEWQASYEGGPAVTAELSSPHIAMADLAGNVYIADKEAHAIRKVSPEGVITTVAGTNAPGNGSDTAGPGIDKALSNPNGLWVRADGVVYVLDTDNGKVRRLGADGIMTTLFAVPGGIYEGRGLWVADDEGRAFVASRTKIIAWDPELGARVFARGFTELGMLVMDPDGHLVAADRGGNRVFRVSDDGGSTAIAGDGTKDGGDDGEPALEVGLDEVRAVWFLPNRGYFLGLHEGNDVWYVDPDGHAWLFLKGGDHQAHGGDGQNFRTAGKKISEVRAVTVDYAGNLIICENDFGFIRRLNRKAP